MKGPAAAILAGGQSRRMGRNKALLPVEGKPSIQRVAEAARQVAGEVVVVANDPEPYRFLGLPIIGDLHPGKGPQAGMEAALVWSPADWTFILSCDLPFLTREFLRTLAGLADEAYDAVVPVHPADRRHPLAALYHRRCLPLISKNLAEDRLKTQGLLDRLRVRPVTAAEAGPDLDHLLFNMNRPADYEAVKKKARGDSGGAWRPPGGAG